MVATRRKASRDERHPGGFEHRRPMSTVTSPLAARRGSMTPTVSRPGLKTCRELLIAHETHEAARFRCRTVRPRRRRVEDAVAEVDAIARRRLDHQDLVGADAETAISDASHLIAREIELLTHAVEHDEVVARTLHLGEAQFHIRRKCIRASLVYAIGCADRTCTRSGRSSCTHACGAHVHSSRHARYARAQHWIVGCAPERPRASADRQRHGTYAALPPSGRGFGTPPCTLLAWRGGKGDPGTARCVAGWSARGCQSAERAAAPERSRQTIRSECTCKSRLRRDLRTRATLLLVDRRLTLRPRLEALVRPEVLRRHAQYPAFEFTVHARGVSSIDSPGSQQVALRREGRSRRPSSPSPPGSPWRPSSARVETPLEWWRSARRKTARRLSWPGRGSMSGR